MGVRFDYTYDVTDELIAKSEHDADPANSASFSFDGLGQMLTNQPSDQAAQATLVATSYEYDPAGHLTLIDTGSPATAVRFGIDALGRHATQSVGPAGAESSVTVYGYLGTSDTVSSSATLEGTADPPVASLTYSAIDAIGDRLTTGTSKAFAYLLPDLHGNVVATMSAGSTPAFSAAYRYDAYGVTCDSYAPEGWIKSSWRYQGRILESAEGSSDLYDFSARSYDPGLGAFTSFDSVTGSALNPATLNRYLYANANPATLVDPDGHSACYARLLSARRPGRGGGTGRESEEDGCGLPGAVLRHDQTEGRQRIARHRDPQRDRGVQVPPAQQADRRAERG